ncbi:DUF3307 domain-containing protein [bacterium SCSIO 12741]|nr:DUF3307 domain-containing protein [bacterium SCSIO 12741]
MTFSMLLVAHWAGDFLFQSSNMALKKSYSLKWLCLHVATYSTTLLLFSLLLLPFKQAIFFALVNGALHLITDFFTSKLVHKYRDEPRKFYPIIGFDQMIHMQCLFWTLHYLDNIMQIVG